MADSQAESKLTMAIADLIHSCGLPFSLASHHKFQLVLSQAKFASKEYVPPGRNKVAGELLDLNYEQYLKKNINMLEKDANVFGLTYFEQYLKTVALNTRRTAPKSNGSYMDFVLLALDGAIT